MIKRTLLIVISTLLIAITSFAQEDSDTWSAYLFDNINYDIIRVNADGTTEAFSLGLAANDNLSVTELTISHDGQWVAYCKSTQDSNSTLQTLLIRNIEGGNIRHEITFGTQVACAATAFNENDSHVAVSIVHHQAFAEIADTDVRWSLRLISLETGSTDFVLDENDAFMPAYTLFGDEVPMLAVVSQFDEQTVTFEAYPYVGMGGPSHVPAYQWHYTDNTVTELPLEFGRTNNDYLPATGELVYPALDENLPAAQPDGPLPQANIVNVMEADGSIRTIYHNEEWVIVQTKFINNGASIAITLLPDFELGQTLANPYSLKVEIINRDGTIQALEPTFDGGTWIANIPNGALITHTPNPTGDGYLPTQLFVWDGNNLTQIGEYQADFSTGWSPPQLLWVTPFTAETDLPSFIPTI